jgi:hypothetical protein
MSSITARLYFRQNPNSFLLPLVVLLCLLLRSSLVLAFLLEHHMDIRRLIWLQPLVHRFICTNEERSTI